MHVKIGVNHFTILNYLLMSIQANNTMTPTDYMKTIHLRNINNLKVDCEEYFKWYRSIYLNVLGKFIDDYYYIYDKQLHESIIDLFYNMLKFIKFYQINNSPANLYTIAMRYALDQKLIHNKDIIYLKYGNIYNDFLNQIKYNSEYINDSLNIRKHIQYITKLQNDRNIIISKKLEYYIQCASEKYKNT